MGGSRGDRATGDRERLWHWREESPLSQPHSLSKKTMGWITRGMAHAGAKDTHCPVRYWGDTGGARGVEHKRQVNTTDDALRTQTQEG